MERRPVVIPSYQLTRQFMRNSARHVAESIFDRNKRRESEINDALKQENARHDAVMKNMQRLRALRIERDAKNQPAKKCAWWSVARRFAATLCHFVFHVLQLEHHLQRAIGPITRPRGIPFPKRAALLISVSNNTASVIQLALAGIGILA
jgi:hypothetical protein